MLSNYGRGVLRAGDEPKERTEAGYCRRSRKVETCKGGFEIRIKSRCACLAGQGRADRWVEKA